MIGTRFGARAASRGIVTAGLAAAVLLAAGGCAPNSGPRLVPAPGGQPRVTPQGVPLTRAERSGYRETSTYADVVAFLDSLEGRGAQMARGSIGQTSEGRDIPYVIASRPLVRTPAEARALGRPVVYVQGNIHGGEVEGKEALQMLLRDLLLDRGTSVLDSLVLIAVPIYNVDGNELWGPQERQRGAQNGPEQVGQRPNAQGFDLNRDYIKAEAPETRASLAMFNRWDPHVFVDLHTTNGSYHGYALTYSPSLHPGAPLGEYTRRFILPAVQRSVQRKYGFPTFEYGNFAADEGRARPGDAEVPRAWYTYDHRPRYGTNYYGLRNRFAILSEAYSHDPFDRRVAATYAFVRELLSYVAQHQEPLLAVLAAQDSTRGTMTLDGEHTLGVALRAEIALTDSLGRVVAEDLEPTGDSVRTEPGVRPGMRRTGRYRELYMPVYTRFRTTHAWDVPEAFILPPQDTAAVRQLRLHGITVNRLEQPWRGEVYAFAPDSIVMAPRAFQGHREVRLEGEMWVNRTRDVPAGAWIVPGHQPLARLALVLLDPMTDDGLVTWNYFDDRLERGRDFPVWQVRLPMEGR